MPALFDKSRTHRRQWVIRSFGCQSDAPRPPSIHLDLADGHVDMPGLVGAGADP
jgi:hypothetical protein